jgi:hypothetical protein
MIFRVNVTAAAKQNLREAYFGPLSTRLIQPHYGSNDLKRNCTLLVSFPNALSSLRKTRWWNQKFDN